MRWASFRRAARLSAGGRWWNYGLAFASALVTTLLVADAALVLDLIHSPHSTGQTPASWAFSTWLGWPDVSRDWLDRYEYYLLGLLAALLVLATVEAGLLLMLFRSGEQQAWEAVSRLQIAVYEQVRRLGVPDWFEREGRQAEQRVLADCLKIREGLTAYWSMMPRSVCVATLLLGLAAYLDFFLSLLAVLLAGFVWLLYQKVRTQGIKANDDVLTQLARRQRTVLDAFRTTRIIEGVTATTSEDASFAAACDRYRRDTQQDLTIRTASGPWLLWLLGMGATLLLVVVGLSPRAMPASLAVLALALARLVPSMLGLRRATQIIRQADDAAADVFAYLDRTPVIEQIAGALAVDKLTREIRWEGVAVGGHASDVLLSDLSLTIPAGSRTAIVASDCHTPLTMVGLLLRYKDPSAGRILFDGTDLRSLELRPLRQQVAFAAADGMLFSGTIADNIRCGRATSTPERIDEAARECDVLDSIKSLPAAFETIVGPGGTYLPAPQAFRLGLARAILLKPSVLVIQEPPEADDEEDKRAVDAVIQRLGAGRTLIVIPSRLTTLRAMERIFLIHQGRLHAEGTHAELLHANALYRHLNYILFTPFRDVVPCPWDAAP